MKVAVACGGTGGHIFPGLATARVLRQRGHDVTLWLAGARPEQESLAGWDGPIERVNAAGFQGGLAARLLVGPGLAVSASASAWRRMRRGRPDRLLAMGSYACVGPVVAARLLGVPVVLHEANAVPGRAIALLARVAEVVALTFESAARYLPGRRTVVTGFPVRPDLAARFEDGVLRRDLFTVLVMGGSQGAQRLNELVPGALVALHRAGVPLQVVHLAGPRDAERVKAVYAAAGIAHAVFGFLKEMGQAYGAADLAISRSGAASCTELAVCGVPALLVPFPWARRDHQTANARELQRKGGADIISQSELTESWLAGYVRACIENPAKLAAMRRNLATLARPNAAERLADLVEKAGGGDGRRGARP